MRINLFEIKSRILVLGVFCSLFTSCGKLRKRTEPASPQKEPSLSEKKQSLDAEIIEAKAKLKAALQNFAATEVGIKSAKQVLQGTSEQVTTVLINSKKLQAELEQVGADISTTANKTDTTEELKRDQLELAKALKDQISASTTLEAEAKIGYTLIAELEQQWPALAEFPELRSVVYTRLIEQHMPHQEVGQIPGKTQSAASLKSQSRPQPQPQPKEKPIPPQSKPSETIPPQSPISPISGIASPPLAHLPTQPKEKLALKEAAYIGWTLSWSGEEDSGTFIVSDESVYMSPAFKAMIPRQARIVSLGADTLSNKAKATQTMKDLKPYTNLEVTCRILGNPTLVKYPLTTGCMTELAPSLYVLNQFTIFDTPKKDFSGGFRLYQQDTDKIPAAWSALAADGLYWVATEKAGQLSTLTKWEEALTALNSPSPVVWKLFKPADPSRPMVSFNPP